MNDEREPLVIFNQQGRIHVGTVCASRVLKSINIAEFGNEVLDYVRSNPGLNLLLNFESVDYLSSAVLTELLRINQAMEQVRGRLRLCAVSPTIQEIFQITRLDSVFSIHGESIALDIRRFERAIEIEEEEALWKNAGPRHQ
jgi:anti-anti-sigma factor